MLHLPFALVSESDVRHRRENSNDNDSYRSSVNYSIHTSSKRTKQSLHTKQNVPVIVPVPRGRKSSERKKHVTWKCLVRG